MAPVLLPSRLIGSAAGSPGVGSEPASRTRLRRRVAAGLAALLLVGAGLGAWLALDGGSRGSSPPAASTLLFDLVGFGAPFPTTFGRPPCPEGRSRIRLTEGGRTVGSLTECVLTIAKDDRPGGGLRSISTTSLDTYSVPGGTVVVRQAQTTLFALDQLHTRAIIRGQVVGGTGRYLHARGTLAGGGPGVGGTADWTVSLRLEP